MDNRITKFRLNNHFSYDWWKYIAIIVASIFIWSLVFTMASPRLSPGETFEIFVYAPNNYKSDRGLEVAGELKSNFAKKYIQQGKNPDILESYVYNYVIGQSETMTVFSTKVQAKEGDLFILGYGLEQNDVFAQNVDNGILADFNTVIDNAKLFYDVRYQTLEEFTLANPKIKEQNLAKEFAMDTLRRQNAYDNAVKLEGYMNNPEYADLFRTYSKMTFVKEYADQYGDQDIVIGEPMAWGLELTNFRGIYDSQKGLFIRQSASADSLYPNIALGISSLEAHNYPLYFENLEAVNYFIETFHINFKTV